MISLVVGFALLSAAAMMCVFAPTTSQDSGDGHTRQSIHGWYAAAIMVLMAAGGAIAVSGVLSLHKA